MSYIRAVSDPPLAVPGPSLRKISLLLIDAGTVLINGEPVSLDLQIAAGEGGARFS